MIIEPNILLLGVFKYLIFILLILYVVFALVVVRQVQLMVSTLEVGFEREIKLLAILHLVASMGVTFFVFSLLTF